MKQLEDKEVELVDWAKEVERYMQREADLQASLQRANDLLLQRDWELETERRKFDRLAYEKEEKIKALSKELEQLEDTAYLCYK